VPLFSGPSGLSRDQPSEASGAVAKSMPVEITPCVVPFMCRLSGVGGRDAVAWDITHKGAWANAKHGDSFAECSDLALGKGYFPDSYIGWNLSRVNPPGDCEWPRLVQCRNRKNRKDRKSGAAFEEFASRHTHEASLSGFRSIVKEA